MSKLTIRKQYLPSELEAERLKTLKCYACAGSGYYDNTDKYGRVPRCSSCNGTGLEHPELIND